MQIFALTHIIDLQWKLLNLITLGHRATADINQIITISKSPNHIEN
jgi:hypothetical protein